MAVLKLLLWNGLTVKAVVVSRLVVRGVRRECSRPAEMLQLFGRGIWHDEKEDVGFVRGD